MTDNTTLSLDLWLWGIPCLTFEYVPCGVYFCHVGTVSSIWCGQSGENMQVHRVRNRFVDTLFSTENELSTINFVGMNMQQKKEWKREAQPMGAKASMTENKPVAPMTSPVGYCRRWSNIRGSTGLNYWPFLSLFMSLIYDFICQTVCWWLDNPQESLKANRLCKTT